MGAANATLEKIENAAKCYAMKRCQEKSMDYQDIIRMARATTKISMEDIAKISRNIKNSLSDGIPQHEPQEISISKTEPIEMLPEKWPAVQDLQGRTYYWNTESNKTQWERPR